ncbi:MAG TPA: histidine phosphatase family protein [Azospirillum sp.]|nr:histidine phosphatase family protein [Azospirillum sp.]
MTIVTRWWLIRHAPVINPEHRIYGQSDVEADTADTAAFRALAGALPRGAVWVATHLRRTQQTTSAIHAAWENPAESDKPLRPQIEPALAEQSFGDWQGLTHDELNATRPQAAHRFWLAPAVERPPGGESFADVVARVSAALERLTDAHAGRDVVAVLHGGPIRAALALALDLDLDAALRFRVDTLSLTRLDHIAVPGHPPAWRVAGVNLPPGAVLLPG